MYIYKRHDLVPDGVMCQWQLGVLLGKDPFINSIITYFKYICKMF